MDEFKCKIADLSRDYKTGQARLTVITDCDIFKSAEELFDKDLNCRLVKFRKKRSLNANAYCWVLIDKLSEKLHISKEELYREYIKNIGGNNTVVCVPDKAVDSLTQGWKHNGLGWQTDTMRSKIDGCTNVILYYGSSTYNTEQMGRLIDLIVQDCKDANIPTITPAELEMVKKGWG